MRVRDLRQRTSDTLTELSNPEDVAVVKEQAGIDCRRCKTLFARTTNGEYVEIYGTRSRIPKDMDDAHEHDLDLICCDICGKQVPAANIKVNAQDETVCADCKRNPPEPKRDSE